jgi:hypothetical protein
MRPPSTLEPIGHVPPAEFKAACRGKEDPSIIERPRQPSLR